MRPVGDLGAAAALVAQAMWPAYLPSASTTKPHSLSDSHAPGTNPRMKSRASYVGVGDRHGRPLLRERVLALLPPSLDVALLRVAQGDGAVGQGGSASRLIGQPCRGLPLGRLHSGQPGLLPRAAVVVGREERALVLARTTSRRGGRPRRTTHAERATVGSEYAAVGAATTNERPSVPVTTMVPSAPTAWEVTTRGASNVGAAHVRPPSVERGASRQRQVAVGSIADRERRRRCHRVPVTQAGVAVSPRSSAVGGRRPIRTWIRRHRRERTSRWCRRGSRRPPSTGTSNDSVDQVRSSGRVEPPCRTGRDDDVSRVGGPRLEGRPRSVQLPSVAMQPAPRRFAGRPSRRGRV